jgi:hypothetical protein
VGSSQGKFYILFIIKKVMKYVLYERENGDMLFTKAESIKVNPNLLVPFENKTPTVVIEADNDGDAVAKLNAHILTRAKK